MSLLCDGSFFDDAVDVVTVVAVAAVYMFTCVRGRQKEN